MSQEVLVKKFTQQLSDHLEKNQFEEALSLFDGGTYDDIIKESSWDIVPIVSSHLKIENVKHNKDLIKCCKSILHSIVEKCNPSETVLELLEQVDSPEDDVKFSIILSLLNTCLSKMNDKVKAIEWCTSTIKSYVESLSLPEKDFPTVIDTTSRIKDVYAAIMLFLEPLVHESRSENSQQCAILRDYLASILISLMGRPLCYLQEKELESHLKQSLPERIITLMSHITGDLLWFLNAVNARSKKVKIKKKNMEEESFNFKITLFELHENITDLAYGNFYFYVITKSYLWEMVPQVYNFQYIFQVCTYLIVELLREEKIVAKGLNLMSELLKRMARRSLTSTLLELNIYFDLLDVLVKVMVYCSNDKERKKALNVFQNYIELFDMQARYFIILHLYKNSEHSGLLSLTTGIFKESVVECLRATPPIPYFLGSNLETLITLACKLQHGSASDLVELSDEIITSLNLLRFLFMRDTYNLSGIWNLVDKLQTDYLKPLRKGIDLCKAHWKVKIKDLEEQKRTQKVTKNIELEKSDAEITLIVGGEKLPAMPISEKISFCHRAVNGLDVMESILIRVNECIAANSFKQNSNNIVTSE